MYCSRGFVAVNDDVRERFADPCPRHPWILNGASADCPECETEYQQQMSAHFAAKEE